MLLDNAITEAQWALIQIVRIGISFLEVYATREEWSWLLRIDLPYTKLQGLKTLIVGKMLAMSADANVSRAERFVAERAHRTVRVVVEQWIRPDEGEQLTYFKLVKRSLRKEPASDEKRGVLLKAWKIQGILDRALMLRR